MLLQENDWNSMLEYMQESFFLCSLHGDNRISFFPPPSLLCNMKRDSTRSRAMELGTGAPVEVGAGL